MYYTYVVNIDWKEKMDTTAVTLNLVNKPRAECFPQSPYIWELEVMSEGKILLRYRADNPPF